MGKLEVSERAIVRNSRVQRAVLNTVYACGALAVGLVAPNVIGALGTLGLLPTSHEQDSIKAAADRLRKKGLLKVDNGHYVLTSLGERTLSRWRLSEYKLPRPATWDKKWRIIIFDIPEKKRILRQEVRRIFQEAGFERLQDSVWVYPYDCEDIVGLIKHELGLSRYILYIIADQIENDRHLRRLYDLSCS
jgi:DNA-binding transcriptional regulator PaaX